jgi:hypothetical protein
MTNRRLTASVKGSELWLTKEKTVNFGAYRRQGVIWLEITEARLALIGD